MNTLSKILNYALQQGETVNHVEKVGVISSEDVYALSLNDADGFPMPIGLPRLVVAKGDSFRLISGEEALHLLNSLDIKE